MEGPTVNFAIHAPIAAAEMDTLCRYLSTLLERTGAAVAVCDVHAVQADAVAVDALARLQLAARRRGARLELTRASEELLGLIGFVGLAAVLPTSTPRGGTASRTAGTTDRSTERT